MSNSPYLNQYEISVLWEDTRLECEASKLTLDAAIQNFAHRVQVAYAQKLQSQLTRNLKGN